MFYQIRRNTDGKVLGGTAKRPEWLETSSVLFKQNGVRSFIGNARKFSVDSFVTAEGEETKFEDLEVVKADMHHSNPISLPAFLSGEVATQGT